MLTFRGDDGRVTVGRYCSIANDVEFMPGGGHRTDWLTTYPIRAQYDLPGAYADGHPVSRGDIVVLNDVWIGRGARIMSGVTIGNGAVVGAYSVVTRDVAAYEIVAGNPAKHIRFRFDDEDRLKLLQIQWWNWSDDIVKSRVEQLCSSNIDALLEAAYVEGMP